MKAYNRGFISLAKALRSEMTPWERKLWDEFLADIRFDFSDRK